MQTAVAFDPFPKGAGGCNLLRRGCRGRHVRFPPPPPINSARFGPQPTPPHTSPSRRTAGTVCAARVATLVHARSDTVSCDVCLSKTYCVTFRQVACTSTLIQAAASQNKRRLPLAENAWGAATSSSKAVNGWGRTPQKVAAAAAPLVEKNIVGAEFVADRRRPCR